METLTVTKLFAPLGKRLFWFESRRYLLEDHNHVEELVSQGGEIGFNPYELVSKIGPLANHFDEIEVYKIAKIYHERVDKILSTFERRINDWDPWELEIIGSLSEEAQFNLFEEWKFELKVYEKELRLLVEAREKNIQEKENSIKTILLASNFALKEILPSNFKPKLSTKQASYFLHYLRELELIPQFGVETYKQIAELIFARNGGNVTDTMRDEAYVNQKPKDLEGLKGYLQLLLERIDMDLKKVKKSK